MGNSINTLTTNFRNALALKGVNAPGDKFETLIRRIEEIVQSGNVLNNQVMISGEYVAPEDYIPRGGYDKIITIDLNLDFDPEYFFIYFSNLGNRHDSNLNSYTWTESVILSTDCPEVLLHAAYTPSGYGGSDTRFRLSYDRTTANITLIKGSYSPYAYVKQGDIIRWYAIGSSQLPNNGGERTITPSTSDQVLPDGYYSGDITVKGDSDLIPENILEGVEIFGVTGNVKQGSVFPEWYKKGSYARFTDLPVGGWDLGSCVYNDDVYTFYDSNAYCLDMDTGNWRTISKMPTTRSGPSVACVGDKIYAIGGSSNKNNECYDPATDTWTTKTSRDGTGTSRNVVYNNIIYFFGNTYSYSSPKCYDPATDTWTAKSGGPSSRSTLDNTVGLINNKIYFIGSYTSSPFMYIYDPKAEVYTTGTTTNINYNQYAGSAVYNNIFYFFCGYGSYSCFAYDPLNDTGWAITSYPSGQSVEHISSIAYKNYIINLGGEYYNSGRSYERTYCFAFIPE